MMRILVIAAVVTASAMPAAGLDVSLKPTGLWDQSREPYPSAELTIDNSDGAVGRVIGAASIRCADGGPTFLYPLALAPRTSRTLRIYLPAISLRQEVDVRLLAAESPQAEVLATRRLAVTWPEELLARSMPSLVDPGAYQAWQRQRSLPAWSAGLKQAAFLACVVAAIAAASTLMIGRGPLRLAAMVVVAGAAAAAMAGVLGGTDTLVVNDFSPEAAADTRPAAQRMVAATCLRTTEWRGEEDFVPIYESADKMADETMLVRPGEGITVLIRPEAVRLFRVPGGR